MTERNVAIVCVSKKAILEWLQFEGGTIHSVRMNPEQWEPDEIELVIEHPDLDRVFDGFSLRKIMPTYRFWKRGRFQKMLRIDPPKGGR